jgi:TRAP-type C4-dicarboxylate transport system permease small subunit
MIKSLFRTLDRAIKGLGVLALGCATVFIGLIMLIGVADMFGTALFSMPVPSALEMSEASLVIVVFTGLAYAQQRRANVTVDILSARFTGTARALSLGLALVGALVFFTFVTWRSGIAAWESIAIDERSSGLTRIPLYPGKIALCLGCLIAALESLRQLVHLCLGNPDSSVSASRDDEVVP